MAVFSKIVSKHDLDKKIKTKPVDAILKLIIWKNKTMLLKVCIFDLQTKQK